MYDSAILRTQITTGAEASVAADRPEQVGIATRVSTDLDAGYGWSRVASLDTFPRGMRCCRYTPGLVRTVADHAHSRHAL